MTWVVPLVLGGVAIGVMTLFSWLAGRRGRAAASTPARAAVDAPRILVHDINDDRCTGCDACVSVCPTNVLDLVNNKSRVLNFQDCIQCEACMWACPTEALVMHVEGTEPPKLKVPEIDENYQTQVPGQYLIGEVAGKPLVKNAANLGRAVVEHMLRNGVEPGRGAAKLAEGSDAKQVTVVDVVIVGSGPGGLSAALTCIQRGLSYVVLEKEQTIASTIARYPKGKFVMAEPYDTQNLSFLPVFDSTKENMVDVWQKLVAEIGVPVKLGESVETVTARAGGGFDVKTTVSSYRSQRVVLAIGTRGKPRTLQVPGENLAKVANLLDDPSEFRGRHVLIIGGGDSAVEASMALADAGAKVTLSYRGRSFNRCQAKNKQAVEGYAAESKLKIKLQSQVIEFEPESVVLQLADGSQKRYPNDAAFVLIGADPPIAWLEKLGVKFVERPHQFSLGKTDDYVRRLVADAVDCSEDPRIAAAVVNGQPLSPELEAVREVERAASVAAMLPSEPEAAGEPRNKWLRSVTNIFAPAPSSKKLDQPMPLSEFAKRTRGNTNGGRRDGTNRTNHTGNGRRDALSPGERTRVLRMLRDVGGRLADEESQVSMVEPRRKRSVAEASPAPEIGMGSSDDHARDSSPKQAVIVGLARAMARGPSPARRQPSEPLGALSAGPPPPPRSGRGSASPPLPGVDARSEPTRSKRPSAALPLPAQADAGGASRAKQPSASPLPGVDARPVSPNVRPAKQTPGMAAGSTPPRSKAPSPAPVPAEARRPSRAMPAVPAFSDEPTRPAGGIGEMADMLRQVRELEPRPAAAQARQPAPMGKAGPRLPPAPTHLRVDAPINRAATVGADDLDHDLVDHDQADKATGVIDLGPRDQSRRFARLDSFDDATIAGDLSDLVAHERANGRRGGDDGRGVDPNRTPSLSDVDWDLD